MEPERAMAAAMAARLLARPALQGLSPLEKEEQALLLLRSRAAEMTELLSEEQQQAAGAGLPQLSWDRFRGLLLQELRRASDRELEPLLGSLLERDATFPFADGLQSTPVAGERCREEIAVLLARVLQDERSRAALSAPLGAAQRDLPGRYLPACYASPKYVHFELAKVERLRLGPAEAASLVRAALLLRASVFLADGAAGGLGPRYAAEAQALLRARLASLPQAVLRSAVMSHLPCQGNPLLPATARLTALFAAAARAGVGGPVRGALPAETSWWGVALRNAGYHGLDASMLEEMRGIAARNGW
jgi:hypothetical protein